jgi:hypothetical protein
MVNGSADPALSATLAGILLAQHIISREQYAAAERFRALRAPSTAPSSRGSTRQDAS